MIDFEVSARRSKRPTAEQAKANYLVLGDFGGRATEPAVVDRDSVDDLLSRLDVNLAGLRIREAEDFHPDRLYARVDEFQDGEESAAEPVRPGSTPKANLEEILQRGSILEQITEGGDPFQRYIRDLARAHAAPAKRDNAARNAALSE